VNAMIYAIMMCVGMADGRAYCSLVGAPWLFQSAAQCAQVLATRLGPGRLIGGRFHRTGSSGGSNVWYECDQRPTSQWQSVEPEPSTSVAPFERVPYVLRHCVAGEQCKDSSVASVSEKACEIARGLAAEYDRTGNYRCIKQ